jgi:trimethylamine--corrinoid protein Co-methyltransferase
MSSLFIEILTPEEVEKIHLTSLDVMEEAGIEFKEKSVLDIFKNAGFPVEKNIVRFPPHRVEEALHTIPERFTRYGPEGLYKITMGGGEVNFGVGSLPLDVLDIETGGIRRALKKDMVSFARLSDALENFSIANACVQPSDVPEDIIHMVWLEVLFTNTRKPFCCWYARDPQVARDTIAVASAAQGGIENVARMKTIALTACPDGALSWGKSVIGLVECSKVGIPVEIMPMPAAGLTHPVTLAGLLAQTNAELLAAAVLSQLIRPGTPLIYAPYPGIFDMREGKVSFGTPETALMGAAFSQLAKFYRFPSNMVMGTSDSKLPDPQAAYEKTMTILLASLTRPDSMSLVGGMLDFAMIGSLEQLVIDNEICGAVKRILNGISVDDESLALDVIKKTGHGGIFLRQSHTAKNYRSELWMPAVTNRSNRSKWISEGCKDMRQRAKEKVREILSREFQSPLPKDREEAMKKVIEEIAKRRNVC